LFFCGGNRRRDSSHGYLVQEILDCYPQLKCTVIPDWNCQPILHTFLSAPFTGDAFFVSYADTIFRKDAIIEMQDVKADIIFAVDSLWETRYEDRAQEDIVKAEIYSSADPHGFTRSAEFTGLVLFKPPAAKFLLDCRVDQECRTLLDLIAYLERCGLSARPFDVQSKWAEFNSSKDIARFFMGSKAETLERLRPLVKSSKIGSQVSFSNSEWRADPDAAIDAIREKFSSGQVIVRSSSRREDSWAETSAGAYKSLPRVDASGKLELFNAVNEVFSSYGCDISPDDQVLCQQFVDNVRVSGVVFTCGLDSGSPYYIFNFDDVSGSTASVTSGTTNSSRTVYLARNAGGLLGDIEPLLVPVLCEVVQWI